MNSKSPKSKRQPREKAPDTTHQELQELKQDMRSAQIIAWVQENQQKLMAAGVALIMVIVGVSLWFERRASVREAAAVVYHKALDVKDAGEKKSLLEQLVREYGDTAYAPLSLMLLSSLDREHATDHLKSLLAHPKRTREFEWQAYLDLAGLYIQQGDKQAARSVLKGLNVGPAYEQVFHVLMAEVAEDSDEKVKHYQQALDAKSYSTSLTQRIKERLKTLKAGQKPES